MKKLFIHVMTPFIRYFNSRAGKVVAFVLIAIALIDMPALLSWGVAAYLIKRAYSELWAIDAPKTAHATLDVKVAAEPAPALDMGDVLDQAVALDMARRGDLSPAVIIHAESGPPAQQAARGDRTRLQRRA